MVIPLGAPGMQMPEVPPADAAPLLEKLRWSLFALIGFGGARLLLAVALGLLGMELMSSLNLFFCISMGIFIFKEDPQLAKAHKCLSTTIFQMCAERGMGGMQCLFPFVACNAMNLIFDLISRAGFLGFHPYGIALMGTMFAEGAGAYFGWSVFKACQASDNSAYEMESGGGGSGGYVQASGDGGARAPGLNPGSGGAGAGGGVFGRAAPASGTTAGAEGVGSNLSVFSGAGNRLGG